MITKFKIFENLAITYPRYMLSKDMFFINDVIKYLGVELNNFDDEYVPESIYNINVINFFKEILMDKPIIFKSVDRIFNYPYMKGEVTDVGGFAYKDEFYIKVKLKNTEIKIDKIFLDRDDDNNQWFLMSNNTITSIYDYDADNKPLHEEVKLKKNAEKYNI